MTQPLLQIDGLVTEFATEDGPHRAVDQVSLEIAPGEVLGLVGESGSGKTVTALSVLRLISAPGDIKAGRILFEGRDILQMQEHELVHLRGSQISMIFQQPKACLNPVIPVGKQVAELFQRHQGAAPAKARKMAIELLDLVSIPEPAQKARAYPHELSGGQAQRIMIAMALALKPRLLIADEPTTALDVTIQAQILELLKELCGQMDTALLLVTHDMGVIAEIADRVAVMFAGQIVETQPVTQLFDAPRHPYTLALLDAVPKIGDRKHRMSTLARADGRQSAEACPYFRNCVVTGPHEPKDCQTAVVAQGDVA